jgi:hypothetical protein
VNHHIPDDLATVIDKSMTRSRSGRYQTAMEFRDALLKFLRRFNPQYRRTKLSRFLKKLWATEIEKELRNLEDVVLDASIPAGFGKNLIADALGPDAVYSRFTPNPTTRTDSADEDEKEPTADGEHSLHKARTLLIDSQEAESAPPPAAHGTKKMEAEVVRDDQTIVNPTQNDS